MALVFVGFILFLDLVYFVRLTSRDRGRTWKLRYVGAAPPGPPVGPVVVVYGSRSDPGMPRTTGHIVYLHALRSGWQISFLDGHPPVVASSSHALAPQTPERPPPRLVRRYYSEEEDDV
eukprot:jgi/Botrbrau1/14684/Bobra.0108s0041.1